MGFARDVPSPASSCNILECYRCHHREHLSNIGRRSTNYRHRLLILGLVRPDSSPLRAVLGLFFAVSERGCPLERSLDPLYNVE